MLKNAIIAVSLLILLGVFIRFYLLGRASKLLISARGLNSGHLAACGEKSNCVSSNDPREAFHIAPIAVNQLAPTDSWQEKIINKILLTYPRATLEKIDGQYAHLTFRSRIFQFIDDLELQWNPHQKQIEVRSCSRVGNSDLGANRNRVESIRRLFESP